jgi:aspartate carbamoyltransferase
MIRLGGHVIPINNVEYSSVVKGETLEDTIRTMQCYSNVIVLRHSEVGAAKRAANVAEVPIINAGDGIGEHPTQALLDFFTILMEKNIINNFDIKCDLSKLNVTMMGDLKHGRTVKSLVKLLRLFNVKINWVAPWQLSIPEELTEVGDTTTENLNDVIENTDVLYVTRIQKERIKEKIDIDYSVTLDHMKKAKSDMILMHPLPRVNELPKELDNDPRSVYFKQMKYGLFVRMAILTKVLE